MTERKLHTRETSTAGAILAQVEKTRSGCVLSTPFGACSGHQLVTTASAIADDLLQRYPGVDAPLVIVMAGDPWTIAALLGAELVGRTAVLVHSSSTMEEIRLAASASRAELLLQHAGTAIPAGADRDSMHIRHGLSWTELSMVVVSTARGRISRQVPEGFLCQQTSGTIGTSKLALRTSSAVLAEMEALRRVLTMTEHDVVLCASAVSHSYGCIGALLTPLLAGASVRIARTIEEVCAGLMECEPSIVFGLGPVYAQLADGPDDLSHSLRKVRFAFSAGAPLANDVFERFNTRFGVPIRQDYGTTETGTISLELGLTDRSDNVGEPLPHIDVQLRVPAAIPLEPGEEGEILVRSPALAGGYLVDGELVPCVDEWGYYSTQDAGSWMAHRLRVHRRLRALPFIHGELVNLDSVQRTLEAMPGVLEAVVSPTTRRGPTMLVATVATLSLTIEDVQAWCSPRLPKNWWPDQIVICERLPRSPSGKILNRYL